jgi:phosphoglycerate dehydrogenase-like enzyme
MNKRKGLFVLDPYWFDAIYAPDDRALLRQWVDFPDRAYSPKEIRENLGLLGDVELLFSGWEGGALDQVFLDAAPSLKAVFYGGGSVRGLVTDAFWERNIHLTSAASANAVPVAEFTLAQIILSLKRTWRYVRELQRTRTYPKYEAEGKKVIGAYQSTVGIVSLGMIGRRVREMLRVLDVEVLAYDPYATPDDVAMLDIQLVSLGELFRRSDVVTIHAPLLKETEEMISGDLIASMKPHATLINTARGAVINESQMIEVLRRRIDLFAVLDVTRQDPLDPSSPLHFMENVVLTPHIAGSLNGECHRMGRWMIEEAKRFLNGDDLCWEIRRERAAILA